MTPAAAAPPPPTAPLAAPAAPHVAAGDADWGAILAALDLQGAGRQLAANCALIERRPGLVRLAIDPRNQPMRTRSQEEKIAQALTRHFGAATRVEIEVRSLEVDTPAQAEQRAAAETVDAARRSFETDSTVQALKERFGATVVPDSVRPVR